MKHDFFVKLEELAPETTLELHNILDHLPFDDRGLLPVITQDAQTKKVLMLAWMNRESLLITLDTKRMTYYSRSRQALWEKGKTSGHIQTLISMDFDCDGDAILCKVEQVGAACHTGRPDCFYLSINIAEQKVIIR